MAVDVLVVAANKIHDSLQQVAIQININTQWRYNSIVDCFIKVALFVYYTPQKSIL